MRLSTRSTYGIRALVELALAEGSGPVSAAAIAERQTLSVAYLEQLLHRLKKGGLIRSVRGPRGGYILARPAAQISMADAVRLLEAAQFRNGGRSERETAALGTEAEQEGKRSAVVAHAVWRCVHERLLEALAQVSLHDVCEDVLNTTTEPLEHRYLFHI